VKNVALGGDSGRREKGYGRAPQRTKRNTRSSRGIGEKRVMETSHLKEDAREILCHWERGGTKYQVAERGKREKRNRGKKQIGA